MAALPKPGDWLCPSCGDHNFARNVACRSCGTPKPDMGDGGGMQAAMGGMASTGSFAGGNGQAFKPGDWMCESCGNHNFARNETCRQCGAAKPASMGGGMMGGGMAAMMGGGGGMGGGNNQNFKPGDWICQSCGNHNFARVETCRKCSAPKPSPDSAEGMAAMSGAGMMGGGMMGGGSQAFRPGDWMCDSCGNHNFARVESCRKCGAPRPENAGPAAMLKQGDWLCPNCGDHNFARNSSCRKCGTPKPEQEEQGRERSRSPHRVAAGL